VRDTAWILFVVVLAVIGVVAAVAQDDDCARRGGVSVRSTYGYVCVKAAR
jgi:hypothetical protein